MDLVHRTWKSYFIAYLDISFAKIGSELILSCLGSVRIFLSPGLDGKKKNY